jgi:hypothetical protein
VETLKCIGIVQQCESILPEIEAAMTRLNRLEERIGDLERVPAIQVLPPNEPPLFSDEERVQELVEHALLTEREDIRRWYMQGFSEQTAEQAAAIDQRIREAKDMMILMYTKIKESLRAAVRGNIMRIEEIVDIAMNLVKGSENYQMAAEELVRGVTEIQHRHRGEELYTQIEAEMSASDLHPDESDLNRGQQESGEDEVVLQDEGDQNAGPTESQNAEPAGGNDGNNQGDGQAADQSNSTGTDHQEDQQNPSGQGSQNNQGSRGNRGNEPPRRPITAAATHPFSGDLYGCFLTVSGRPNITWTRSEYERLTRNGYNLVRTYDTFEQAMAWLRRKRHRYRRNNPDAPDADWSTSDEEDDPDEDQSRASRRNDWSRGNDPPRQENQDRQSNNNNQQSDGVNLNQQQRVNANQNQNNTTNQSNFQPFDVRSQDAREFQSNARERRRQSRGYGNRRNQPSEEEEQEDDPHQWMLEFNVTPTGMWENGWLFYDDTDGRIPLNYTLAVAMREGVPGAELEYEHWLAMAKRVSKSLKVLTEDYENYDPERDKQEREQRHTQQEDYDLRWQQFQQANEQRERPWNEQRERSWGSPHNGGRNQRGPVQYSHNSGRNNPSTPQPTNQFNSPLRQQYQKSPMQGSTMDVNSPRGWSAKKAREEDYLMGYAGVPQLEIEDLMRLGFQHPENSIDTIGTAHYSLMINYEGTKYDGYSRGPKHDKLM